MAHNISFPWRRVEEDSKGITTIYVNEEDLSDFPRFMRYVLKEKHGHDKGVFKIHLDDSVVCSTQLSSLIELSLKYYTTEILCNNNGRRDLPRVEEQGFFYGSYDKDVFGYRIINVNAKKAKSNRDLFLNEIKKPTAFSQKSTCEYLLERSVDSLSDYYWATIRRLSGKSTGMALQQDTVEVHQLLEAAKTQRQLYGLEECATGRIAAPESSYQSHVLKSKEGADKLSILYAAGVPVGDAVCTITPSFSLSSLGTVMDIIPSKIPGFSSPFLYFGMEMSSFAWHIEDIAAFSLNYLHFGAPCIWFIVPPQFFKLFKEWTSHFFLDRSHVACSNVLGASHKYVMASATFLNELGIPVHTVVQKEREMVILYPYTAHSGFKTGNNVQEAVNFLDPWSVELSIFAPTCECYDSCVQVDLKELIAVVRPDLLQMYVEKDLQGLIRALKEHKYLQDLGILPSCNNREDSEKLSNSFDAHGTTNVNSLLITARNPEPCSSSDSNGDTSDSDLKWKGSRCDIKCPGCDTFFKGGRSKLNRVEDHIKKKHKNDSALLQKLHDEYPPKPRKSKLLQCQLCGEWKAGGTAQMKIHINRKHVQNVQTEG